MKFQHLFATVLAIVLLIVAIPCVTMTFENLDAGSLMVIQSPMSGKLEFFSTPGVKYQAFGKVTKYDRRRQLWFSSNPTQGKKEDESLRIRFNDGGHATVSGGISWEMPVDEEHLTALHTKFGSTQAIEHQLVKTIVEKAVYMTGPLMSSTESYASRRNELLQLIEDQVNNGIYRTRTTTRIDKDPITGADRTVNMVELILDKDGHPQRAEDSPLAEFGIHTFNLSINEIKYEGKVEEQIQQQQQAAMQVQIAMAEAKRAEQQVITTKKEGEASAAKAEWEQKTIAAKEQQAAEMQKRIAETQASQRKNVAEMEAAQKLNVAKLDAQAAEQFKQAETLRGEGEAARRKLVMEADGALEKKLEAWARVQEAYARAIQEHRGPWVPTVVMGESKAGQAGASQLIEMLTVKTALDLGLDMKMKQSQERKKE